MPELLVGTKVITCSFLHMQSLLLLAMKQQWAMTLLIQLFKDFCSHLQYSVHVLNGILEQSLQFYKAHPEQCKRTNSVSCNMQSRDFCNIWKQLHFKIYD